MSIFEIRGGPITHRYLMGKSKDEIATMYMRLLRETETDAKDAARYRWLRDSCSASMNCVLCLRRESSEWAEEIDAAMALTKPENSP